MAHSLSGVYVHLVFATKDRRRFLMDRVVRQDVHQYMVGITSARNSKAVIVGGVEDHVHLLINLGRTVTIADLVRDIKRGTSTWIKENGPEYGDFQWQSGYAAISVGKTQIDALISYISNQEEHHNIRGFQDEYRTLLFEAGIQLDEKYMWE